MYTWFYRHFVGIFFNRGKKKKRGGGDLKAKKNTQNEGVKIQRNQYYSTWSN